MILPASSAAELLEEFRRTGRQEPFEEIVRRYAAMVFHVSFQVTRNRHDAEDATQAVFLTLAVQARTKKEIRAVGPWLQQVAQRVALDLRKSKKRRVIREERHSLMYFGGREVPQQPAQMHVEELRQIISEELNQLPAKYRLPLILHYFGGLSRDQMAQELGCKAVTLGVRLHRGREMLGARLAERGVTLAGVGMGVMLGSIVQESVAEGLLASTCHAAAQLAAGQELGAGLVSAQVLTLARSAGAGLAISKLKAIIAAVLAATAVAAGAEVVSHVRPLDLKFQMPLELKELIRPLLDTPLPPMRVDKTDHRKDDKPIQIVVNVEPEAKNLPALTANHPLIQFAKLDRPAVPSTWAPSIDRLAQFFTGHAGGLGPASWASSGQAHIRSHVIAAADWQQGIGSNPTLSTAKSFQQPSGFHNASNGGWNSTLPDDDQRQTQKPVSLPGQPIGSPLLPGTPITGIDTPPSQPPQIPPVERTDPQPTVLATLYVGQSFSDVRPKPGRAPPPIVIVPTPATNSLVTWTLSDSAAQGATTDSFVMVGSNEFTPNAALINRLQPRDGSGQTLSATPQLASVNSLLSGEGSLTVRPGLMQGYGAIVAAKQLDHNGQLIADGLGVNRELNLSAIQSIVNSIDNPRQGPNGYFAVNRGKLVFPAITVLKGTGIYTWGESPQDATLDLINSVRVEVIGATGDGEISLALLASDRQDYPAIPGNPPLVGLWEVNKSSLEMEALALSIRYDDLLARQLGLNESRLKLWEYDGQWRQVADGFTINTSSDLIGGRVHSPTYIAVTTPEPGVMVGVVMGSLLLARRRRR